MINDIGKSKLKIIHDSIVRMMKMISEDFDKTDSNNHFINEVTNFSLWSEEKYKYKFRNSKNKLVVKKGQIYNCNFGRNIGCEQDKLRPAIILQNDKGNIYSSTTIVAPITDEIKAKLPTHVNIKELKSDCTVCGDILIEQLRCVSKNRLEKYLDTIDTNTENWKKVIKALKIELDVSYNIK